MENTVFLPTIPCISANTDTRLLIHALEYANIVTKQQQKIKTIAWTGEHW